MPMKTQPWGIPEQKDLWTYIDKSGPPPLNAPALLVFEGDERPDESGIELTYGYRVEDGYFDCVQDKNMPAHYSVIAYFLAPPWRAN